MFSRKLLSNLGFALERSVSVIICQRPRFLTQSVCCKRCAKENVHARNKFLQVKFTLPSDYFTNSETGMESCKFPGKIHVVKNEGDEERLVREGIVLKDFESQDALGMDVEFTPVVGKFPEICLIQLASQENAVLWTCQNGSFRDKLPPYLESILIGDVLKVGHALCTDALFLRKHYGPDVKNIVDTLVWAKELNCDPMNLRAVCAIFLHERLAKALQRSDWTKHELSEKQLCYAATDAWASLRVYQEMKRAAEEIGLPLSLPFKSTLDVLELRVDVKRRRRRRLKLRKKEQKEENKEEKSST